MDREDVLREFDRDPSRVLDLVIRGLVRLSGFGEESRVDVILPYLFSDEPPRSPRVNDLDRALAGWLRAQLGRTPEERRSGGERWLDEVARVISAVATLRERHDLPVCRELLHQEQARPWRELFSNHLFGLRALIDVFSVDSH